MRLRYAVVSGSSNSDGIAFAIETPLAGLNDGPHWCSNSDGIAFAIETSIHNQDPPRHALAPTVTESLSRLKQSSVWRLARARGGSNSDGIAFAIETIASTLTSSNDRAPTVTESLSRLKHQRGVQRATCAVAPTVTESLSRLKLSPASLPRCWPLAPTVTESLSRLKHENAHYYWSQIRGSNSDGIAFAIETIFCA